MAENSLNTNTPAGTPPAPASGASNTSTNQQNAPETPLNDTTTATTGKVSLIYIGHGIWKDGKGIKWSATEGDGHTTSTTMTQKEYEERKDIVFMVGYGAMKLTKI